jgi:2-keto-3-deoxy-L-rhamnonate aldolase RhmA
MGGAYLFELLLVGLVNGAEDRQSLVSTYYFGPVGESGHAIFEYFARHGNVPENVTNAADFGLRRFRS